MRLKQGFELQDICGEQILVPQGEENLDFTKLVTLNETAAFIWNTARALGDFNLEQLTDAMCREYEVEPAQAGNDIEKLLTTWKEEGLIED